MLHEDLVIKALKGTERETRTNKCKDIVVIITYTLWRKAKGTWNPRLLKRMRLKIWSIYITDEKELRPANNSWMLLRFGRIRPYFHWRLNDSLDSGNIF